jgi:hypothetical protein
MVEVIIGNLSRELEKRASQATATATATAYRVALLESEE